MKKQLLFFTLLAVCGFTLAQGDDPKLGYHDKINLCMAQADMFQQIAYQRGDGQSPQTAYVNVPYLLKLRTSGKFSITQKQIKTAINLVYFDRDFSQIPPDLLQAQVYPLCMNDWKTVQFQPLK
jgi:hypothetical protein